MGVLFPHCDAQVMCWRPNGLAAGPLKEVRGSRDFSARLSCALIFAERRVLKR